MTKGKKLCFLLHSQNVWRFFNCLDDFPTVIKILQLSRHQLGVLQLSFDTNGLELVQIP